MRVACFISTNNSKINLQTIIAFYSSLSTMTTKKEIIPDNKEIYDFLDTIYTKGEKILIAISWWADSIYVTLVIQQYRKHKKWDTSQIHYIYCDHGVRKDNNDQLYIKKYVTNKLHIAKRGEKEKNTEASLRKRRYEEIQTYMEKHDINKLITGHHLSDRIESTFLNLLRGCAIDGFISMQRNEKDSHLIQWDILRPLLKMSKEQIQYICDKYNIQYSHDHTNEDITISRRNRLRHTVLKEIKNLSHKKTKEKNSFEDSMLEIYTAIENIQENTNPIQVERVPMYKHRQTKRAYKRNIKQENITTDQLKKLCKQLHIQNNMNKKNIKELSEFLQKKNKWHKYINDSYFFISQWSIYIINGPKRFWEMTTNNHPKNIEDLFDQEIQQKKVNNRRFNTNDDKIHGKSIKKRCTNQKIPIFRRQNIIGEIQENQSIKPIIRDFMKSNK